MKKKFGLRDLLLVPVTLCGSGCAHGPVAIPNAPPTQAQAVVFDIDGTLTPNPGEFLGVRPDAVRAARAYAAKGYQVIYLSARHPVFAAPTHCYLKAKDFPEGIVRVGDSAADVQHPLRFKQRLLHEFRDHGWQLAYAYGDSDTDFFAYSVEAIPRQRVFALRREAEADCERGTWEKCLSGWSEHLDDIAKEVPPAAAR